MSLHELFLNRGFQGVSWMSGFGMVLTMGIALSCICRLNAAAPSRIITAQQALYMGIGLWTMEAFTDLLFFQYFSGHDIVFGVASVLYLSSTYKEWQGHDCVSDALNWWRLEKRERLEEIRRGINYGRRATDRRVS